MTMWARRQLAWSLGDHSCDYGLARNPKGFRAIAARQDLYGVVYVGVINPRGREIQKMLVPANFTLDVPSCRAIPRPVSDPQYLSTQ